MRCRENPKLLGWLLLSAVLHLCAALLYFYLQSLSPIIIDDRHIIAVSIIQKGKHRDEKLMPRLVPQEPKSETPVVQAKPPIHEIKANPKEAAKEAPQQRKNPLDALQRRLKALEKEGNPNAPDFGKSVTGELSDAYTARVEAMLQDAFAIPRTISESSARRLRARIKIKIGADGELLNVLVTRSSKNADYDNAVIANAKEITSFGPPPIPLRKKLQRDGLEIDMCPYKCPEKD